MLRKRNFSHRLSSYGGKRGCFLELFFLGVKLFAPAHGENSFLINGDFRLFMDNFLNEFRELIRVGHNGGMRFVTIKSLVMLVVTRVFDGDFFL